MKIYKVGGVVRDHLLGIEAKDCDYVVVDSNEKEMLALGYEQVGKDFPVFLHPENRSEYALARTERKTAAGYGGFEVSTDKVTLEEDLFRRDLTINAMAMDNDGNIIDPYGGQNDLKNKILRHVSKHFKEDPVRILRIARFSARYNFTIHPDTLEMMKEMVDQGEFDSLTAERVWKEFEKTMDEPYVENFFNCLNEIGAVKKLSHLQMPDLKFFQYAREFIEPQYQFLSKSFQIFKNLTGQQMKHQWKLPLDVQSSIILQQKWSNITSLYQDFSTEDKLKFIQDTKAIHHIEDAKEILYVVSVNYFYNNGVAPDAQLIQIGLDQILNDVKRLHSIDYQAIIDSNKGKPIKGIIFDAQLNALQNIEKNNKIRPF